MFDFEKGTIKFIGGRRYPLCNSVLVDDVIRVVIDAASDQGKLIKFEIMRSFLDARYFEDINALIDCYGDINPGDKEECDRFLQDVCHYSPRKVDILLKNGMLMDLGRTQ